ncbi:hypothetical protein RRG08_024827 [Elysia crispata]|uniref:Uncharacterized protein n=1 Tax=Elysia crispata TaxID=231223 RepID=A0AAE1D091_9GAST|nr:hypothetical protein RRG08_024827 [Elysia crispata]
MRRPRLLVSSSPTRNANLSIDTRPDVFYCCGRADCGSDFRPDAAMNSWEISGQASTMLTRGRCSFSVRKQWRIRTGTRGRYDVLPRSRSFLSPLARVVGLHSAAVEEFQEINEGKIGDQVLGIRNDSI